MVYIFADVLKELVLQARYRRDPCAALLIGGYYKGPAGLYIEIDGFDSATYLDKTRDALSLFQRHHPRLSDALSRDDPTRHVIGWSHGLPGSGGQLSAQAAMVHLSFFNLPWQTTFILDPDAGKLGVYRRSADEAFENIGFNVISAIEVEQEAPTSESSEPLEAREGSEPTVEPSDGIGALIDMDEWADAEPLNEVEGSSDLDEPANAARVGGAEASGDVAPPSGDDEPVGVVLDESVEAPQEAEIAAEGHAPVDVVAARSLGEESPPGEPDQVWQEALGDYFEGVGAGDSKESFGLELDSAWHDAVDGTSLEDLMEGWSVAPGAESSLKDHQESGEASEVSPEEQSTSPQDQHAEESGE